MNIRRAEQAGKYVQSTQAGLSVPLELFMSGMHSIELRNIGRAREKFDKTGTAEVIVIDEYGVCIKDEGDFVSVQFASRGLTEIGNASRSDLNFTTSEQAFAFAGGIQRLLRNVLAGEKARRLTDIVPCR